MRSAFLLTAAALMLAFAAGESLAEKKQPPDRNTMLRACERKALKCEQECDRRLDKEDLTNKQYKSCNDKCEDRVKKCRRRVDELRPERTNSGGGGDSGTGGGLLLSPD
jgi:cytochrome oxidase Cu insertion factor (SCO1/SenC/PrrC family)